MKNIKVLSVVLICLLLTLTSCGAEKSDASYASSYAATEEAAYSEATPMTEQMAPSDYSNYASEQIPEETATALPLLMPENSRGKQMRYTVHLRVETTTFMGGIRTLMELVGKSEGYVTSASVTGRSLNSDPENPPARYATYNFDIPSKNLSEFMVVMEDTYNLLSMQQNSEDVTAVQSTTSADIEALEAEKAQLESALEKETDDEKKIDLQYQLTDVSERIARLQAQKTHIDDDVLYSQVTVELYEAIIPEERIEKTFNEVLKETNEATMLRIVKMGQGFVLTFITLIPALIVLAIILILIWLMRKYNVIGKLFPPKPPKPPVQAQYNPYQYNQNQYNQTQANPPNNAQKPQPSKSAEAVVPESSKQAEPPKKDKK